MKRIMLAVALFSLVCSTNVAADTHIVKPDGTGDFPSIQAAIDASVDGDIILLTDGIFYGSGNRNIRNHGKRITIQSQRRNPGACIIDCQNHDCAFFFTYGDGPFFVLEGITIRNGYEYQGGGIGCATSAAPTIRDCIFENNRANNRGGAIFCREDSHPTIENCRFINNTSMHGGAICITNVSNTSISYCTFAENTASASGGAITCEDSAMVTITHCTMYRNQSSQGNGIFTDAHDPIMIENTIISFGIGNQAVRCESAGSAALSCCDVFGNAGGDWVGCIGSQYGMNGNIQNDPRFFDPYNGDFRLRPGSPCLPDFNPTCGLIGAWSVVSTADIIVRPNGSGNYPTIQAAINAATDGQIIGLADGEYTGYGNRDLDYLGKRITIRSLSGNPNTCTINCEGSYYDLHRGFHYHSGEDSTSVLKGVTIKNGYVENSYQGGGGAILLESNSSPTFKNCKFIDNISSTSGGGVYCTDSSPIFAGCDFIENYGNDNGGGIMARNSYIKITDCTFSGGSWDFHLHSGGAIYCQENTVLKLDNCTFTNTVAYDMGGAISSSYSSLTLNNCTFTNTQTYIYAGCISSFVSELAMTSCSFNYCTNIQDLVSHQQGPISIIDCSFSNNTCRETLVHHSQGSISIIDCSFSNNASGCIVIGEASVTVSNCTFSDNIPIASGHGGGIGCGSSSGVISDCLFENNYSLSAGGGISCGGDPSPLIEHCTFINNSSDVGSGGIYCSSSSAVVNECLFKGNFIQGVGGGGISIWGPTAPTISNCVFEGNYAENSTSGAGIYMKICLNVNITNCTFYGNNTHITPYSNGVIYLDNNSSLFLNNSIISFNPNGAAVICEEWETAATLNCCNIYGNPGGNYTGYIADQLGVNGNISADPLFCDTLNRDFTLDIYSPCLPSNNSCGTLMGAYGWGCGTAVHDHFEITYPDNCGTDPNNRCRETGEWVTVHVRAVNTAGITVPNYSGTITVSANGDSTGAEIDWMLASGNGTFADGGPGNDTATYTFDPADNGVVDLRIRDDCQDFVDPEVVDNDDPSITDDDTEEYITFIRPDNLVEGEIGSVNVDFGAAIADCAENPIHIYLVRFAYMRWEGGYLPDPTVTVVPYKDVSLLDTTPPPNFKMIYDNLPLEAPYPYCNGYNYTVPGYPPSPKHLAASITQTYAEGVLEDIEEQNIQLHHWNGTDWEIILSNVNPGMNLIEADITDLSQLSPFYITQPEEENIYTAYIWIEPTRLNTYDTRGWIYGYIEIEGSFGLGDIDIATVTCNPLEIDSDPGSIGVATADPGHAVIGDQDGDGIPDLELCFDRATIVSMFATTSEAEPFMIRGFMNDGYSFFKGLVTIETVDEPVAVALDLNPETINIKSKGKWVTAYIEMSEFYSPEEVDRSSLHIASIAGEAVTDPIYAAHKPSSIGDFNDNGIPDLMVKFDRQQLQDLLFDKSGLIEITVEGILEDSTAIRGIDDIKVIHSPFEQFAITGVKIIWDEVTTPDRLHLDAFSVRGFAKLNRRMTIGGLSWDVHFLLSLAGNAAVFEESVSLLEHCGGFLFVYDTPEMNGASFIERLIICDPTKWHEGMEIPEGLLDNDGMRFVRDILDETINLSERLFVYVRGTMDLSKDWEAKASPRDACIVLETFTIDEGSLANVVLIGEADLRITTTGGSEVWEFRGMKEAEIDIRPELANSDDESTEEIEPAEDTPISYRYALFQNHPNPFNPATAITYELAEPAYVQLKIFDVNGRLVRTLVNGSKDAGRHEAIWNGTDRNGHQATSGIYFYSIKAGDFRDTRKLVLLR